MAILTNQTSTVGTIEDDSITGTSGNDTLGGGAGNDIFIGGAGDDSMDGGSGYNTVRVQGSADAFYWSVNAAGKVLLTDMVVDPANALDGSNEGADTLTNIQAIEYVRPDGTLESTFVLDDYGNAPDAGNYQIQFGVWVNGRANFYGDVDYFKLATVAGQKVVLASGTGGGYLTDSATNGYSIQGQSSYISSSSPLTWSTTGTSDIHFWASQISSGTPMASQGYSFILRRQLDGTDGNDSLVAGTSYEQLVGGLGNDTLTGSGRSDALIGGDGDDLMTAGAGNDQLDGDGGTANVAVFSGNRADYTATWRGSSDLGLTLADKVAGRDGTDTLRNVQILRFADGDVVLDAESNVPTPVGAVALGQAMVGSLPINNTGNQSDVDYFQQKFTADITSSTVLRITVTTTSSFLGSGYASVQFRYNGTTDTLVFADLNNVGNTLSSFGFSLPNPSESSWLVSPLRWGTNTTFLPTVQRADVQVTGYFYTNGNTASLGDLANYSIRVDRVLYGTNGNDVLVGDSLSSYIDARDGNDSVTGSDMGEQIVGGAGNDTLLGGAGNDTLVAGQGNDVLDGGLGDDTIDLRNSTDTAAYTKVVDGGAGTDTLLINNALVLTGLTAQNVEILDAGGLNLSQTPAQLAAMGFTTLNNVSFTAPSGGVLDVSAFSGTINLYGSSQNDTLTGNAAANRLVGNGGQDTLLGGAGDDTLLVNASNLGNLVLGEVDGGLGVDRLVLNGVYDYPTTSSGGTVISPSTPNGSPSNITDISTLALRNIEQITGTGGTLRMTAAQLQPLTELLGVTRLEIKGGGTLDMAQLQAQGVTNWQVADALAYTYSGTAGNDVIMVGAGVSQVNAGAGDDSIAITNKPQVTDVIDGGAGTDVLVLAGGDLDLSGAMLQAIESIVVSADAFAMTQQQWTVFQSLITQASGATTAYMLAVPTPGSTTLAVDAIYAGVSGSAGNDQITGNANANRLLGGAGNDVLTGLAGNDRLVSGAGVDSLYGGDGDDTLVISDKTTATDVMDGGAGLDTLLVTGPLNLTGASLAGIEVLASAGTATVMPLSANANTVTLTAAQSLGLAEVRGLTVQLGDTINTFALEATKLTEGAKVWLANVDPSLVLTALVQSGTGVFGSVLGDTISGGAGGDQLWGGTGRDLLQGAGGNDTLVGGAGLDTLQGGTGDDRFVTDISDWTSYTGPSSAQFTSSDIIDGGAGLDTLVLSTIGVSNSTYRIASGSLTSVEQVELLARVEDYSSRSIQVNLDASDWLALTSVQAVVEYQNNSYSSGSVNWSADIKGNGADINFINIKPTLLVPMGSAGTNPGYSTMPLVSSSIRLSGSYNHVDASNKLLATNTGLTVDQFNTALLSDGNDRITINGDTRYALNAGAGDDQITQNFAPNYNSQSNLSYAKLVGSIDGGTGSDVFNLSGAYSGYGSSSQTVDITGLTLMNVEAINQSSTNLVLTPEQLASLNFAMGTTSGVMGNKFVKTGTTIQGTDNADTFGGDGTASFVGGAGTDTIMNVKTAVFSGNLDDYNISNGSFTVWFGNSGYGVNGLIVTHARGIQADGTDQLSGVMQLQFADVTLTFDDAPNIMALYAGAQNGLYPASGDYASLTHVTTGQTLVGKVDYSQDVDVFAATMAANSPLAISAEVPAGASWNLQMMDAATGQAIYFKSLVTGAVQQSYSGYSNQPSTFDGSTGYPPGTGTLVGGSSALVYLPAEYQVTSYPIGYYPSYNPYTMSADQLWQPVISNPANGSMQAYQGGEVVLHVQVNGVPANSDYKFTFNTLDDFANDVSTLSSISMQTPVNGYLADATDTDLVRADLSAGTDYVFRLQGSSSGLGTLLDPVLTLMDANGKLVRTGQNEQVNGLGTDDVLNFSPSSSGTYYLVAQAAASTTTPSSSAAGTWQLTQQTIDTVAGNATSTTVLDWADRNTFDLLGLINQAADHDWFRVTLTPGSYEFKAESTHGANPLADPQLALRSSTGELLAYNNNADGSNAVIQYTASQNAEVFLDVGAFGNQGEGLYRVSGVALSQPLTVAQSTGSAGADTLQGSTGADTLVGLGGNDVLLGNDGNDQLLGGLGHDSLASGAGADALDGSSGNDTLDGGLGADTLSGGPGDDVYRIDQTGDVVLEVISGRLGGYDTVQTSVSLSAPQNVETLVAAGSAAINLTGNTLNNHLQGNDQTNLLQGGDGRDWLEGRAGDDTLDGGTGVDSMAGGAGNDTYLVDVRNDVVTEQYGEGTDTVLASTSYTLGANVSHLVLQGSGDLSAGGNALDNHLVGNSGNNTLVGGMGRDTLEGGLGNDVYVVNDAFDTLIDTGGIDTVRATVDLSLLPDFENVELIGFLNLSAIGNAGNNRIAGNAGCNILDGGLGADTLTGGAGSDQFVIGPNGTNSGVDQITDFTPGSDVLAIDLRALGIDPAVLGISSSGLVAADTLVNAAGAKASDANDHFIYNNSTGMLSFDADGLGAGAAFNLVQLFGPSASGLTASDLYLVV